MKTAAVSVDLDGAHEAVNRFRVLSVRDASPAELCAAVTDLTRAGARVDSSRVMVGKALLGQLLQEVERRASRTATEATAPRRPSGPYTDCVNGAARDYQPRPNSVYA